MNSIEDAYRLIAIAVKHRCTPTLRDVGIMMAFDAVFGRPVAQRGH